MHALISVSSTHIDSASFTGSKLTPLQPDDHTDCQQHMWTQRFAASTQVQANRLHNLQRLEKKISSQNLMIHTQTPWWKCAVCEFQRFFSSWGRLLTLFSWDIEVTSSKTSKLPIEWATIELQAVADLTHTHSTHLNFILEWEDLKTFSPPSEAQSAVIGDDELFRTQKVALSWEWKEAHRFQHNMNAFVLCARKQEIWGHESWYRCWTFGYRLSWDCYHSWNSKMVECCLFYLSLIYLKKRLF